MGWRSTYTEMLAFFLTLLAAALVIAGVCAFDTQRPDTGVPPPLYFTTVSYAQDKAAPAEAQTDLKNCIITLAYVEFIVDGAYHTPKVTITCKGRKLRKNTDYKLAFKGGKDAGISTVTITGIGAFKGEVTRNYTGIAMQTTATAPLRPPKTQVTTRTTKPAKTVTATKPVQTVRTTKPAKTTKATRMTGGTVSPTQTARAVKPTATVNRTAAPVPQTIRSITAYTFAGTGRSMALGAKTSSGLKLTFRSSNPKVVAVDGKGVMKAKKGGIAKITISQAGSSSFRPASRIIRVRVPTFGSREDALQPWRHVLIDTFFHINGRKYSHGNPGKYWTSNGKWNGKTGKKGNTQSCVTLSTVSLKRLGLLSAKSGCVWLSSNHGTKPNKTVRRLHKSSRTLSVSYPHKSLKYLAQNDLIRYGDILCRSGHTFVYMGKDSGGHPLIYESGSHRDIGNGTRVVWGHHDGGHADKLTGKINKQIERSDAVGEKWRKGKLSDAAFCGHRASGKNLNKPVHIVCSIRTFKVRTSCINGTISPGRTYMAGESVTIKFTSPAGKPVEYVKVDGRKVNAKSKYTFRKITADHAVEVKYRQ